MSMHYSYRKPHPDLASAQVCLALEVILHISTSISGSQRERSLFKTFLSLLFFVPGNGKVIHASYMRCLARF